MKQWITLGLALGLAVVLGACGDDDEITETPTGNPNGTRCVSTRSGASVCAGELCATASGEATLGVCTEHCHDRCRFGGECVREADQAARCLVRCANSAQCGDHAVCQSIREGQYCTSAGCSDTDTRTYCVPLN